MLLWSPIQRVRPKAGAANAVVRRWGWILRNERGGRVSLAPRRGVTNHPHGKSCAGFLWPGYPGLRLSLNSIIISKNAYLAYLAPGFPGFFTTYYLTSLAPGFLLFKLAAMEGFEPSLILYGTTH